ncbi:MAG: hypothetical protein KIT84_09090 [Labilithrix sp.]|nr:hypothetical protein [Labilithrix sp.]MCW5811155.1 hypothetical protein [Labilithrix sp.]
MTPRRIVASATLAALTACTLFNDLDGFAEPVAAPADAPPDAPADAIAIADADAGPAAPADAAPDRCAGDFCDDFDEGGIGGAWTAVRAANGAVDYDTELFVSPPRALRVVTGTGGSAIPTAYLERAIGFVPASLSCTFQVRPNTTRTIDSPLDFFQVIGTAPGVENFEVKIAIAQRVEGWARIDVNFADGGCGCPLPGATTFVDAPPVGVWTKVQVDYDFTDLVLRYADRIVYSAPLPLGFVPAEARIALGVMDFGRAGSDVSYDDLVCTFKRP